jgi:hypothetical protein
MLLQRRLTLFDRLDIRLDLADKKDYLKIGYRDRLPFLPSVCMYNAASLPTEEALLVARTYLTQENEMNFIRIPTQLSELF